MDQKKKIIIAAVAVVIVAVGGYFLLHKKATVKQINISNKLPDSGPANQGNVSPISGEACSDWNRRPFAVMQPADVSARPIAGFSDADMVFEMPVINNGITRLMGVYVCGNPDDVGSMRSARHDFIALAAGIDAIFVHWGGSHFALDKLKQNVINDLNCNNDGGQSAGQYCYRKPMTGTMKGDDTGYAKFSQLLAAAKHFGYDMTDKFSGYPHQADAPASQRPNGGHLHLAFDSKSDTVNYDYDPATNSYLRTWGGTPDTDRNNGKRLAPKNVVVMFAKSEELESQYNNMEIGDPWYDNIDSGEAYFYMNGQQVHGSWKKDKSNLASKLTFYDDSGNQIKFVPGQIWVEVEEPGQGMKWTPNTGAPSQTTASTATANSATGTAATAAQ